MSELDESKWLPTEEGMRQMVYDIVATYIWHNQKSSLSTGPSLGVVGSNDGLRLFSGDSVFKVVVTRDDEAIA